MATVPDNGPVALALSPHTVLHAVISKADLGAVVPMLTSPVLAKSMTGVPPVPVPMRSSDG